MLKLWTFGDSFTQSFLPNENIKSIHWRHHYIKWKGYAPKVYGELLSERLGMELMNYGMGTWDNYSIFESFCKVVKEIKKDDLVIFGWSDTCRFRLAAKNGQWINCLPSDQSIPFTPIEYMDRDSINKLLANRSNRRYDSEVNNWINLINHTLRDNYVIHWTPFANSLQVNYFGGFDEIRNETKGEVDDGHFSEQGQLDLSKALEQIYNRSKNKELI
jgi:hypothetical protein